MNALRTTVRTAARPLGRRNFIEGLNKTPNQVAESRAPFINRQHLHGAENPTYLKQDGDKMVSFAGLALCFLTWGQITVGLVNMKHGVGKCD